MPRDRAAAQLLSGGADLPLVIITARLLTEVHGMLIRLLQVEHPSLGRLSSNPVHSPFPCLPLLQNLLLRSSLPFRPQLLCCVKNCASCRQRPYPEIN